MRFDICYSKIRIQLVGLQPISYMLWNLDRHVLLLLFFVSLCVPLSLCLSPPPPPPLLPSIQSNPIMQVHVISRLNCLYRCVVWVVPIHLFLHTYSVVLAGQPGLLWAASSPAPDGLSMICFGPKPSCVCHTIFRMSRRQHLRNKLDIYIYIYKYQFSWYFASLHKCIISMPVLTVFRIIAQVYISIPVLAVFRIIAQVF